MCKRFSLFLFIAFLFNLTVCHSQSGRLDSLRALLNNKTISEKSRLDYLLDVAFEEKYTDLKSAKNNALAAVELGKKLNLDKETATAYKILGAVYDELNDFKSSLENNFNAINYYEKARDTMGVSKVEANLGMIFRNLHQQKEALKYFHKSLSVFKKYNFAMGENHVYTNLGAMNYDLKQYDSALVYFFKSLKIVEAAGMYAPFVYSNIANCYTSRQENDKAEKFYKKAMAIHESKGDLSSMYYGILTSYAALLSRMGQDAKALSLYEKCLKAYRVFGLLNSRDNADLNEHMSFSYARQNQYEQAYKSLAISNHITDSLFNLDFATQLNEMKEKYESDKKELNIESLNKEKKLKDVEIKHQSTQKYAMAIGLVLTLCLLFVVFRSFGQSKRANKIIAEQKLQVEKRNAEVEHQKQIVEMHQKEIVDSINYAKRIQNAILAMEGEIKTYLPESFLLYKPKDIVAGDFYFFEASPTHIFYAAVDCTGHGVPGALVSVICANALTRCVKEFNLAEPGLILDKARDLVVETFKKSGQDVKDGMDISLISIQIENLRSSAESVEIKWSGANNPLWYINGSDSLSPVLTDITADKQPIGQVENAKSFTTHSLKIQRGGFVFLLTDGYADQFGGPSGKKFKYKLLKETILKGISLPVESQKETLDNKFEEWKGGLEQVDDVCLIGIKI
jgi:serine phosphatase RsbU (regulator of sigma subunit)